MSELETETTSETAQQGGEAASQKETPAILKNVQEMLNEEKWTRATLGNYSTNQFKELDAILREAKDGRIIDELKKNCDDHLTHTRNSIIALYLSGMVALSRQIIDDSAMINLVTIFVDNHKWGIVKYLCERILDYGESKFALRTLIDCCKNDNEEEAVYSVLERLVKVDYEEADLAKSLAEHYEKQSNMEAAIDYYKKALHRYINKALFTNVREIWEKLLAFCPDDIDFFLHVQKKIAKTISEVKAVDLLKEVYAKCKDRDIDTAIAILKIVLQYEERDVSARREIAECFKKKYAAHSQLEEYLRISNLSQNYRNVHEAITDFEKHIAFDRGNFVFHRSWGVGRIAGIEGDDIKIDFAKMRGHSMSLKMAVDALQTLPKDHIWVLKATWKREKLYEKVKSDIAWTLKIIIKSFGNSCDLKRIKAELCPGVLTEREWSGWNSKARDILKSDPGFGISPDNIDNFTVRERPISITEKLYNEFKAERNFFDRAATIRNFMNHKNAELDSEYFAEMFSYFAGFLRSQKQSDEQTVAAYLLVKELAGKYPHLGSRLTLDFAGIFKGIEDVPALFSGLRDNRFKEEFLRNVRLFIPQWADIYVKLFPHALVPSIITRLEEEGYTEKLKSMTASCFEDFRDNREAVVWLFKNTAGTGWYKSLDMPFERQLIVLVHILNLTYRDIENQRNTTENRKINKQVYTLLFKEGCLNNFIDNAGEDTITRIYTFINDVKDLDPQDKLNLKSRIQDKYPEFKFFEDTEKKVFQGLIVTAAMYGEKQKQLKHIMEEDVPANSKEIEFALSLGDLRENSEYKAAKEKQDLLNSTVAKLKEEIERSQIFDPGTVNASRVSFGTSVTLRNETTGNTESYTILGPWESDPDHNIISYLSPFGKAILNKTAGEQFTFLINDEKNSYVVERIQAANS
ncbi:MAG: transcription elongation factor GreA [Treponema sp.]|jgi:transcription elongation factor GreA|nr:transcription elongation factor GreA [Treponema sp.]